MNRVSLSSAVKHEGSGLTLAKLVFTSERSFWLGFERAVLGKLVYDVLTWRTFATFLQSLLPLLEISFSAG